MNEYEEIEGKTLLKIITSERIKGALLLFGTGQITHAVLTSDAFRDKTNFEIFNLEDITYSPKAKVYAERSPPVLAKDLPPYVPPKYSPKIKTDKPKPAVKSTEKTVEKPVAKSKEKKVALSKEDKPKCPDCKTNIDVINKGVKKRQFGGISHRYYHKPCAKHFTVRKTAMDVARDTPKEPVVSEKREKKDRKKELNEKVFKREQSNVDAECPKCNSKEVMLSGKNVLKDGTNREYYRCRVCNYNFSNKKDDKAGEEAEKEEAREGVLECPKCNEQGGFRELSREKKAYGDKVKYRCVVCEHEFTELEGND